MKEVKRTPIPLPGSKTKKSKSVVPPPSTKALSKEFVDSSDDSSNEEAPKTKATKKAKGATTIAVHRPKVNETAKKPAAKEAVPKKTTPKKTPAPKKVVAEVQEPESDSSSSEESEEESEESEESSESAQAAPKEKSKTPNDASESASSSDSSDSSSDSDEEMEDAPAATRNKASNDKPRTAQSHTVEMRQAQPFVPPKGFTPAPTSNSSSRATKLFENLEGKQVWHITAPANVPLKNLKELTLDKALGGEAVISHKGSDYGFARTDESEQGSREVLIPRQNGYKAVSAPISQTLHLQQVLKIPDLSALQADQNTGSVAAASIIRSTIRAPRPQIKGLKMRFFPTGSGGDGPEVLGESESEDEAPVATSGLSVPKGIHPGKSEKRKHGQENGFERAESPTKKVKKHRTLEEIKKREEKKAKKEKKKQK